VEKIYIPDFTVSKIIGRDGETIKETKKKTQCSIMIEDWNKDKDRLILLKGTKTQIDDARDVIEKKVREVLNVKKYQRYMREYHNSKRAARPMFVNQHQHESDTESGTEDSNKIREELCDFDSLIDVIVSSAKTPESLWVQKFGDSSVKLNELTREMTEYYSQANARAFHSFSDVVYEDSMVAAQFAGDPCFYRAKVMAASEGRVTVHFVDYGDTEERDLDQEDGGQGCSGGVCRRQRRKGQRGRQEERGQER